MYIQETFLEKSEDPNTEIANFRKPYEISCSHKWPYVVPYDDESVYRKSDLDLSAALPFRNLPFRIIKVDQWNDNATKWRKGRKYQISLRTNRNIEKEDYSDV